MSEYWKSTPKYWCKHCSAYVKDTPFERRQHETTGKHQGNLKRFLRGIQNDHERDEREKQKAKDEIERLNRVVGGSAASLTPSTASSLSAGPAARKSGSSTLTAGDQKRQWAQLAEMGIQVPEKFRTEMAMPGDWQTVSEPTTEASTPPAVVIKGVRKRRHEDQQEEDEEMSSSAPRRGWGAATKRYPGSAPNDLDLLLSGSLMKRENATPPSKSEVDEETHMAPSTTGHTATEAGKDGATRITLSDAQVLAKHQHEVTSDIKQEEPASESSSLPVAELAATLPLPTFKKRKAKAK